MRSWHNEFMKNPVITLIFSLLLFFSQNLEAKFKEGPKVTVIYQSQMKPSQVSLNGKALHLELGEKIKSFKVTELSGKHSYRVFLQTESSVTIMDEGPHLDLTDWKHGLSGEVQLQEKDGEFLYVEQFSKMSFPEVSLSEMIAAAKKKGGERWAKFAKKCNSPKEYPCSVAPSKFTLRVEKLIDGEWVNQGVATLIPPMGC